MTLEVIDMQEAGIPYTERVSQYRDVIVQAQTLKAGQCLDVTERFADQVPSSSTICNWNNHPEYHHPDPKLCFGLRRYGGKIYLCCLPRNK